MRNVGVGLALPSGDRRGSTLDHSTFDHQVLS
jgi:hypothetical protein